MRVVLSSSRGEKIVLHMRTAARDMRRGVLARRLHGPPPRIAYDPAASAELIRLVGLMLVGAWGLRRRGDRACVLRQLWLLRTAVLLVPLLYIRGKGGTRLAQMLHASPAISLPPRFAEH